MLGIFLYALFKFVYNETLVLLIMETITTIEMIFIW